MFNFPFLNIERIFANIFWHFIGFLPANISFRLIQLADFCVIEVTPIQCPQ